MINGFQNLNLKEGKLFKLKTIIIFNNLPDN